MNELSEKSTFLLAEFENSNQLTYHIDGLRSSLIGFFLLFAGAAGAGLAILIKDEANEAKPVLIKLVIFLLALVGVLGTLSVIVLAKLRGVQLERFRIINNIREHFLGENKDLWNIVELSRFTLPAPTRKSGTYFWTLQVELLVAVHFGLAVFLLHNGTIYPVRDESLISASLVGIFSLFIIDFLYLRLARPPARRNYSDHSLPGKV
jgi:hypothetical protein